eukprot:239113-Rhodomonas_salina.1
MLEFPLQFQRDETRHDFGILVENHSRHEVEVVERGSEERVIVKAKRGLHVHGLIGSLRVAGRGEGGAAEVREVRRGLLEKLRVVVSSAGAIAAPERVA